ncbi:MAG TPA: shikimate dehydrogenase [Longimicrobiaceae bacterium]|nr:shikimate dehydrogenase [Longimicrobiaceae bacterium]
MTRAVSAATRLFAVLGDPVGHSLSPSIQNAAFDQLELDAVYVALRCDASHFPGLMRGLAHAGGGGNITIPHKQLAASLVDGRTPAAQRTGACNTFWYENGEIMGDNTDVAGFAAAAYELLGSELRNARVLLLGAGGAARAVLCALLDAEVDEVIILNRSQDRSASLVYRFGNRYTQVGSVEDPASLSSDRFDLVVNATSLGLSDGDPLPLPLNAGPTFRAALDLVYGPDETPWVRQLRQNGILAADGREMLVRQGAASFRRWWQVDAPVERMREALINRI